MSDIQSKKIKASDHILSDETCEKIATDILFRRKGKYAESVKMTLADMLRRKVPIEGMAEWLANYESGAALLASPSSFKMAEFILPEITAHIKRSTDEHSPQLETSRVSA
jgi:hypothetical protein